MFHEQAIRMGTKKIKTKDRLILCFQTERVRGTATDVLCPVCRFAMD